MLKSKIVLLALFGASMLTFSSHAQTVTNPPPTVLETLESAADQLTIKATAPMGSITCPAAVINVVCKEDTVVSSGHKEHGVYVGIVTSNGQVDDRTVIDFDELNGLLDALDYMNNVSWSITSLSSFDVNFTTRAGFRVSLFSSKRSGQIEFAVRSSRMNRGIVLTPDQRAQLRSLLDQARTKINALRNQ